MLAPRQGKSDFRFASIAPYLLHAAAKRKGHWEITVYETKGALCCSRNMEFKVRYSEEEYSKLARTIYHGLSNQTKQCQFMAGLQNVAQILWPTGSTDHVAMRHVGVVAALEYITRSEVSRWCMCWSSTLSPTLRRLYFWEDGAPSATGGSGPSGGGGSDGGDGKGAGGEDKKPGDVTASGGTPGGPDLTPSAPPPPPDENQGPPKMDCPATPDDAANAAEASDDGRTITRSLTDESGDGVVAVVGQHYDKEAPVDHMPIVGVMVGPCQLKPNVYAKTADNLKAAINERLIKKAKVPNLSAAEKKRIGKVISQAMSNHDKRGLFSKQKIQDWAIANFDLEAIRSGKWSNQRFKSSLENLWSKERPKFNLKADIKYECMPEGKAPRMLIADGDDGQLMALAVVRCFEDLLFDHFEEKSIKHCAKHGAIGRAVKNLKKAGARAIEGDGSAWDTTCNVLIRSLVENPILKHITQVLGEFGVMPQGWMEEHQATCEKKKLRLFFQNKFETMTATIDAIRRSGHRGTSCLNWWMNFIMWVCSIFQEPERFLDPSVRTGRDLAGIMRWWNGCFEGDDSLCTLKPPMLKDDELSEKFLAFWSAAGFNMKIVFCDTRATFCGWHIGCTGGEINEFRCPELPRALANSGVSVSSVGIQAAKDVNRKVVNTLAAASALARAADFAGILPSVSEKYLEFAESCSTSNFQDREMSMRTYGEDGFSANAVREMIKERNLTVTPQDEMKTLKALGVEASDGEIATFKEYTWCLDPQVLVDYGSFRESLPANWRCEI